MTVDYGSNNNNINNNQPVPQNLSVPPLNLEVIQRNALLVSGKVVESIGEVTNHQEYHSFVEVIKRRLENFVKPYYEPCSQESFGFKFWANGGSVQVGPFSLPKWAQVIPTWSFNALRIYIILYRDAKWKDVGLGFGVGATISLIAPPVLGKAKEIFRIGNVDPGLMFLVNTITNVYTIVFSSSWAARAIGFQMGGQAHEFYRAYWSRGKV